MFSSTVPKPAGILLQPRAGHGISYRGGCCRQRLVSLQHVQKKQETDEKALWLLQADNWVVIGACHWAMGAAWGETKHASVQRRSTADDVGHQVTRARAQMRAEQTERSMVSSSGRTCTETDIVYDENWWALCLCQRRGTRQRD